MVTVVPPAPSSDRFTGGQRAFLGGLIAAGAGLGATVVLYLAQASPEGSRGVLASYLTAFAYWLGVAVAASIWLGIFHAARARWPVVIRRPLEIMGVSVPLFALLAVPVLAGMGRLFDWVSPDAAHYTAEQLKVLAHKRAYLNPGFFVARAVFYFAFWAFVGWQQWRWSVDQDETGSLKNLSLMRRLGPASLPFLGLTITFAAFDWLMSLDPLWGSTIFGAYYFAGSFRAGMAVLAIATLLANRVGMFGSLVTKHHLHSLGKLLFAFTAFWAYIAFSQFMLIWIANIPEEAAWYKMRMEGQWQWVGIVLIICNFVVPFFFLLSRWTKLRPRPLFFISCWILFFHLVDLHWIVRPAIGQAKFQLVPFLETVVAWVGVGGLWLAVCVRIARGRYTVPVKDPFLEASLRYTQP